MSATITWSVTAMNCLPVSQGNTDVVITVHWQCAGEEESNGQTYNTSIYSTCQVTFTGGQFTPYDQLTQNQVLGWIWSNGVDQAATEAAVQQQLDNLINPPVVTPPLPWSA